VKILEPLIAARTPKLLWQTAEGVILSGGQGIVAHGRRLQSSQRSRVRSFNRPSGDSMPADIQLFPFAPDASGVEKARRCMQAMISAPFEEPCCSGIAQNLRLTIRKH
jgi:hypothetical protein